MTLPRVLSLARDGSLRIEPAEELESLRRRRGHWRDLALAPGGELFFDELRGDSLELGLEASLAEAGALGLKVGCSPGGEEQTVILCDRREGSLLIDTTRSSLDPEVWRPFPIIRGETESQDVPVQAAPFELRSGERLKLRVFLDRSILEVFSQRTAVPDPADLSNPRRQPGSDPVRRQGRIDGPRLHRLGHGRNPNRQELSLR